MSGEIKRSVTIAGHRTSVALEPEFWDALKEVADARALSISALIAEIDATRLEAPDARNLSRAIRLYLFRYYRDAH